MANMVKPGFYTIQCEATSRFLDMCKEDLGDGLYQNCLLMGKAVSDTAKWEIIRVGEGYLIKHADSELYCAVTNAGEFEGRAVSLSAVPTVWTFAPIDPEMQTVAIFWSASLSNIIWQENPNDEERAVRISTIGTDEKLTSATWRFDPVKPNKLSSTGFVPGIYALQNKASDTYVSLAPDEKSIGCWPESDLKRGIPKWEFEPFGDGYTIKMYGTEKYCTVLSSTSNGCAVTTSAFPSAWRIEMTSSPVHEEGHYCQIYWGDTNTAWELNDYGSPKPGTSVTVYKNDKYKANRIFKLVV